MINQEREIEREKRDRGHIHNMIYNICARRYLVGSPIYLFASVRSPSMVIWICVNQLNSAFSLSNLYNLILYLWRKKFNSWIYDEQTPVNKFEGETDSGQMEIRRKDIKGKQILGRTNIHSCKTGGRHTLLCLY